GFGRWNAQATRHCPIAPDLDVMNGEASCAIRRLEEHAEAGEGSVEFIDEAQRLTVHGLLEVLKEGLHSGEIRPWCERAKQQPIVPTIHGQLSESSILCIEEDEDFFGNV